jgi:AraC-like DNA-binding protein
MATQNLLLTNRHLRDLNPLDAGSEICKSGKSFGPYVRRYTLLHYVLAGCGTFYARGEAHRVKAGEMFVILPGEVTTYTADTQDPWHYVWIGFDGALSAQFATLPPVLAVDGACFQGVLQPQNDGMTEYRLSAQLMQLYAALFSSPGHGNQHVRRVENYIRSNYMHPIRVERIARELSLDRRYLSRLFKENMGCSIQEYLVRIRLEEAERLLLRGCSVNEAARLSGYEDVSNFSKMFKKRTGKTPASIMRK